MPKFIVERPELHYSQVEVEAKDAREAVFKVHEHGEGEEIGTEYNSTFDIDDRAWSVHDASGQHVADFEGYTSIAGAASDD